MWNQLAGVFPDEAEGEKSLSPVNEIIDLKFFDLAK